MKREMHVIVLYCIEMCCIFFGCMVEYKIIDISNVCSNKKIKFTENN